MHAGIPTHQYDISDGDPAKQPGGGGGVEHHMTRVFAARARQRFFPRQLSTCHLQEHTLFKKRMITTTTTTTREEERGLGPESATLELI